MFENFTMEEVEARLAEIEKELRDNGATADVDKLTEEVKALEARKAEIKTAAEKRKALLDGIAAQRGVPAVAPETQRSIEEIRKSPEYVNAFVTYIKTRDDSECRALLTDNTEGGTVPVPAVVEEIVRHAWEKNSITRYVKRVSMAADMKVHFNLDGSDATTHTEGGAAIDTGSITDGIVTLTPEEIMKEVEVSRESYKLGGEGFLRYVYEELTYRIAKAAAKNLITRINACNTVGTSTQVNVGEITATAAAVGIVAEALAELSDDAANPAVILNKKSWGALKQAQYANKFNVDPFEGLEVIFNNDIKSLAAATTGETWMIVGDLGYGAEMNLPAGDSIDFIVDKITKKKNGMVVLNGSQMVAIEPVAPLAFCKVKK